MSDSDFYILHAFLVYADSIVAGLVYGGFLAVGIALVRYGASGSAPHSPARAASIAGFTLLLVASIIFWVFPWNFVFVFGTIILRWNQLGWDNLLPAGATVVSIGSAVWLGMRAYGEAFRNNREVATS